MHDRVKKVMAFGGRVVRGVPSAVIGTLKSKVTAITGAVIAAASAVTSHAAAVDVTGIGTGLVTDVATAGGEGLLVFGALFGIRVVIRAFASAAG